MKKSKFIRLRFLKVATLFFVMLTVVSCKKDEEPTTEEICIEHFNYEDTTEEGPSNWENYCVSEGTNECGSVERQSPIDIIGAVNDTHLSVLDIAYTTSTTDIVNNGHTIQFNYNGPASNLTFEGETYSLLQFHFHADSEHTVAGSHHPLEAHLVHKSASGNLAVIGVFFEVGAENDFLANFTAHLPQHEDDTYVDADLSYSATSLVDLTSGYYNYSGSLTTPPCSEIVDWIVLEQPMEATQAQLDAFSSLLHHNYRPVQPLNGRIIKHKQ